MRIASGEIEEDIDRDDEGKGHSHYEGVVNLPALITAKNLKPLIPNELYVTSIQGDIVKVLKAWNAANG